MRSITEYRTIYREIASNLGLQGDSVELLVQFLAQASYIDEVENVAYLRESSLETAMLMNSKIQHCVNSMYSVYRGSCPRVIMRFTPKKFYSFNPYDILVESNNFRVYYLGYWEEGIGNDLVDVGSGISKIPTESGFHYGPVSIPPATNEEDSIILIGFLAAETVDKQWTPLVGNFYQECIEENLSEDMFVRVNAEIKPVTRVFEEHILKGEIFDLTLPSFGSRLYFPEEIVNIPIEARYFKLSSLDDYNVAELKKICISGSELVSFDEEWLAARGISEVQKGLVLLNHTPADSLDTIHYKASRDKYVGSIIRSNSDIGSVLEELYPRKVVSGGTTYEIISGSTGSSIIYVYYIPIDENNILTKDEISVFENEKKIYYITDNISVQKGYLNNITVNIDVDLYNSSSIEEDIQEILKQYENKFGLDFSSSELLDEISTLIKKLTNVKKVNNLTVSSLSSTSDASKTYYKIDYSINAKISSN